MGILTTKKKASQNHSLKLRSFRTQDNLLDSSFWLRRYQHLHSFLSQSADLSPAAFPVLQIESACPVNQPSSLGPAAMCAAVLARERERGEKAPGFIASRDNNRISLAEMLGCTESSIACEGQCNLSLIGLLLTHEIGHLKQNQNALT